MAEIEITKLKNGDEKSLQNSNQQFRMNEKLCKFISNLPTFIPQFYVKFSLLLSHQQFNFQFFDERKNHHGNFSI